MILYYPYNFLEKLYCNAACVFPLEQWAPMFPARELNMEQNRTVTESCHESRETEAINLTTKSDNILLHFL